MESGSEADGKTKIKFLRRMHTCFDESFDPRDVGDTVSVRFALGNSDLPATSPTPANHAMSSSTA